MKKKLLGLGMVFWMTMFGGGCTFTPPIKVKLQIAQELNCHEQHASLPVLVRLYQLADADKFERASFVDLWKNDSEILGSSLLAAKELTVMPKSELTVKLPKNEKTKYLAIVAIFRNPEGQRWRALKELTHFLLLRTMTVQLKKSELNLT